MKKIDIELLKKIKESKYDFTGIIVLDLARELMENIGDKDGYVRDELVYPILAHLLHDDVLSNDELNRIANEFLTEKYLFYDIENKEEFSVLTRSFTLLQLTILVYKHNQKQILEEETFKNIIKKFLVYFDAETDFRGYVSEVGWCHSIAHSADLFDQIMRIKQVKEKELKKMFKVIQKRFMIDEYQFIHDEDERMVTALEKAIRRDILPKEFISDWITQFKKYEKGTKYPEAYHITFNVKRILRSLYFRFLDDLDYSYISKVSLEILKENEKK